MKNNPPAWLYRRPRLLNLLHMAGLAYPHSQMNAIEKNCLKMHATGCKLALEIGTYMGVTASIIAEAMDAEGKLYCVDPFEKKNGVENPGFLMAVRALKRSDALEKVNFLRGFSTNAAIKAQIPPNIDFILVDGDHSYEGLANDWQIVLDRLAPNGIVCLHDTTIPKEEPYRDFGSVHFYNDVICNHNGFTHLETVYSMNVLVKK